MNISPRLLFFLLFSLALLFLFSSCEREWIEFRGNRGLGIARTSISPPVAVKWKLLLNKQSEDRRHFNQPLLIDNSIYFGSADGNFYSLDLRSGYMNWAFRSGGPINSVAYADETRVYFGSSDGIIYALSRESGEVEWQFQTTGQVNSTVTSYEDMIAAAADADALYFINADDGNLQFSLDNAVWRHNSFQIFNDILAFAPGTPTNPYSLSVYDLKQNEYLWELGDELSRYFWYSFPAVKNRSLYFSVTGLVEPGIWEHYFAAIALYSGDLLWEQIDSAYFDNGITLETAREYLLKNTLLLDYAAPLLWRRHVIFAMGDQILRSYNNRNGRIMWQKRYDRPLSTAPTLAGDRLYFGLESPGELLAVSPLSGAIHWRLAVEGSILNSPVIAGPWIIFGTDEGYFYVLEEVF